MLKNATMDSGTMTDHLVKVGVLRDVPNEIEKRNLLIIMGVVRWNDLKQHGVNVAFCFGI